jgi:hypothetical protein
VFHALRHLFLFRLSSNHAVLHVHRLLKKVDLAPRLASHLARLCHLAGGELEQIQYLPGDASVQTTERYLGFKQKLNQAVNDNLGLQDT